MNDNNELLIQILQTLNNFQLQTAASFTELRSKVEENKKEIEINKISIFKGLTEELWVKLLNNSLSGIILNKINKSAPIRVTIQNVCSSKFLILMVGLNKTERIKKIIVITEIITEPINIKSLPELL